MMSDCLGNTPVAAKTDREMSRWLSERADELGLSKSELIRRLFEHYRESHAGKLDCPHCGDELRVSL